LNVPQIYTSYNLVKLKDSLPSILAKLTSNTYLSLLVNKNKNSSIKMDSQTFPCNQNLATSKPHSILSVIPPLSHNPSLNDSLISIAQSKKISKVSTLYSPSLKKSSYSVTPPDTCYLELVSYKSEKKKKKFIKKKNSKFKEEKKLI
jgi:hypothetical protein